MSDPVAAGTASFNLLMLAGYALGGAMLARATLSAKTAGESGAFLDNKIATLEFYCGHVLPRTHAYLVAATADPGATMAIDAQQL